MNCRENWFITPPKQTVQFVNLQIFQSRDNHLCKAKSACPGTAPSQQISECEDEWFGPFLLFIVSFCPRIPNYQFPEIAHTPFFNTVAVGCFHGPLAGKLLLKHWALPGLQAWELSHGDILGHHFCHFSKQTTPWIRSCSGQLPQCLRCEDCSVCWLVVPWIII